MHSWAQNAQIPALTLSWREEDLPARPGTGTSVSVKSFQTSLPEAGPTRGLYPRLPGSPSEGRGLRVRTEAGPPLRNLAQKCWRPLCELLFPPQDAGCRNRATGSHEGAGKRAHTQVQDRDALPRPAGEAPKSLHTL